MSPSRIRTLCGRKWRKGPKAARAVGAAVDTAHVMGARSISLSSELKPQRPTRCFRTSCSIAPSLD